MSTLVEQFGQFASANLIEEATAYRTVTPGYYQFQGNKIYAFDEEKGFARIGGKVFSEGMSRGVVFLKLQWKEERDSKGRLKSACKLFGQALKALYPTKSVNDLTQISAKELVDNLMKYPVTVLVTEYYQVPDPTNSFGSRRERPKTEEEVKAVREQGGVPKNEVIAITVAR